MRFFLTFIILHRSIMSQELLSHISEYEVMYTAQVTQKIKKWCDGKLKYYKFNNKVEIFNNLNILVGSSFLKNDKLLDKNRWGYEFKARGLLITIECLLNEVTRDISKVFNHSGENKTPTLIKSIDVKTELIPKNVHLTSPIMRRRKIGLTRSTPRSRANNLKIKQVTKLPTQNLPVVENEVELKERVPIEFKDPNPGEVNSKNKDLNKLINNSDSMDNNCLSKNDQILNSMTRLNENKLKKHSAFIKKEKLEFELELEKEELEISNKERIYWDDGIDENELSLKHSKTLINSNTLADLHKNSINKKRINKRKREIITIESPLDAETLDHLRKS